VRPSSSLDEKDLVNWEQEEWMYLEPIPRGTHLEVVRTAKKGLDVALPMSTVLAPGQVPDVEDRGTVAATTTVRTSLYVWGRGHVQNRQNDKPP